MSKNTETELDKIFPPHKFGGKGSPTITYSLEDLLKLVNNSIDEETFGGTDSRFAVKRAFETTMRDILKEKWSKGQFTKEDYLQLFARVNALTRESYNAHLDGQFLLMGRLLSRLSDIGHNHMDLTAKDFENANLNPQDYIRLILAKEKGVKGALSHIETPTYDHYTWAVLPPQFWRKENEAMIENMTTQEPIETIVPLIIEKDDTMVLPSFIRCAEICADRYERECKAGAKRKYRTQVR